MPWYDGQSPGPRPAAARPARRASTRPTPACASTTGPATPTPPTLIRTLADLRRQKDPDEIDLLRRCMRATEAGHAWARANVRPGMTELDVYCGVNTRLHRRRPARRSSSTATSPSRRARSGAAGRRPSRVLEPGDMFILDFSVVIGGYRSDFTNTLVVGREPDADQQRLYDLCIAGDGGRRAASCAPARPCLTVYDAVRGVFEQGGHGRALPAPRRPRPRA